jgi:hypothetical protein
MPPITIPIRLFLLFGLLALLGFAAAAWTAGAALPVAGGVLGSLAAALAFAHAIDQDADRTGDRP